VYLISNRTLVNVVLYVSEFDLEGEILPDSEYVKPGVDTSDLVPVCFLRTVITRAPPFMAHLLFKAVFQPLGTRGTDYRTGTCDIIA